MGKRNRKNENQEPGVNPLRLTAGYLKSKHKPEPDPKRYSKQCYDCKTIFFGDSQAEADDRETRHNCPG